MQPAKKNYEIYDKELLTIMEALAKWQQYLLNTIELFEIQTDHENLKYFRKPHKLNGQQARQYLKLQDYNFVLQHIPGKTNTKADILSKKDQVNTKNNNKDAQMLKEDLWMRRTTAELTMLKRDKITNNDKIIKEIRRNNTREQEVQQLLKKEDGLTWKQDGIVYVEENIYIPNNQKLKKQILWENHDNMDIGHLGQQRIMKLVKQKYWWPEIKRDIKKYVQGCFKYQQNKV